MENSQRIKNILTFILVLVCALGPVVVKQIRKSNTINTVTVREDGKKCAECFRRATTYQQYEKCERKRDAYIEKYVNKGISYSDMSVFMDEVQKGMTNSKVWDR